MKSLLLSLVLLGLVGTGCAAKGDCCGGDGKKCSCDMKKDDSGCKGKCGDKSKDKK